MHLVANVSFSVDDKIIGTHFPIPRFLFWTNYWTLEESCSKVQGTPLKMQY